MPLLLSRSGPLPPSTREPYADSKPLYHLLRQPSQQYKALHIYNTTNPNPSSLSEVGGCAPKRSSLLMPARRKPKQETRDQGQPTTHVTARPTRAAPIRDGRGDIVRFLPAAVPATAPDDPTTMTLREARRQRPEGLASDSAPARRSHSVSGASPSSIGRPPHGQDLTRWTGPSTSLSPYEHARHRRAALTGSPPDLTFRTFRARARIGERSPSRYHTGSASRESFCIANLHEH